MKTKILQTDYPLRFADNIVIDFQSPMDANNSFIISSVFFDEWKPVILIDNPFSEKKKKISKDFIKKWYHLKNGK